MDIYDAEKILTNALYKWGNDLQMDVAIEEMAELTQRLVQYKRGRVTKQKVLEEIADTWIMLEQLKLIFDEQYELDKPDFYEWRERKLLRLDNRINKDGD